MLGKWYAKPIAAIMAMVLLLAAGCAPDKNQGTGAEAEKKKMS